jgi:queuine tRNA-ribosyltransferase
MDQMVSSPAKYDYSQSLFPIVQGSTYKDLRQESAKVISSFDAVGNAIGGLSVGEPEEDLYEMTALVTEILPVEKPRYLMGVGTPWNLLECIALGVDMFDCVLPSRNARHGLLYTAQGTINIKNQKWSKDFSVIDAESPCFVDQNYSKAYLRHLLKSGEFLGMQIATIHNLSFYLRLMKEARSRIIDGTFTSWKNKMVKQMNQRL